MFLKYMVLFSLFFEGVACNFQNQKKLPSLNETYRRTDKLPFGSFVAYQKMKSIFHDYSMLIVDKPFDVTWNDMKQFSQKDKYSLYVLVAKNLILTDDEVIAMINYVSEGNDIFISADYVDAKLLENIFCTVDRKQEIKEEAQGKMHETQVSMYFGPKIKSNKYGYYYYPFLNSISAFQPEFTKILGVNEENKPNYALFFLGKGRVYLHVAPRVFSNYFLLTDNNFQYFENMISYLRLEPERIFWDEYYKNVSKSRARANINKIRDKKFSSLSVIMKNPALLWAFSIGFAGLMVYLLFNIKRKQRIIGVVKPNSNATVSFTETIGRLYFQQHDNHHIAEKMITYFYEYIRNRYFINTSVINKEFINSLAGKSGVSKSETEELFLLVRNIQSRDEIRDEELQELNSKIENFKQKPDGRKPG